MGASLAFEVPLVVGVVIAVILVIALALMLLLDLWTDVREWLGEIGEWWQDRRR